MMREATAPATSSRLAAVLFSAGLTLCVSATADTTPDPLAIPYKMDVHPGTLVYSNPIPVTGIDEPTPIEIASTDALDAGYGLYCRPPFTSQLGVILDGQWFCIRHRAGYGINATTVRVGTLQGPDTTFTSYTIPDSEPAPAGFPVTYNAPPGGYGVAGPVLVTGLSGGINPGAVYVYPQDASYQIDCTGQWFLTGTVIQNGQTICARVVLPGGFGLSTGTLFLGSARWSVSAYTGAPFTATPAPFSFMPARNVRPGARVHSASSTISGLAAGPAPISVTGGLFETSRQSITPVAGLAFDGDTVRAVHDAPMQFGATTTTTVTIGTASASFTSTTLPRKAISSGGLQDFNGDGFADIVWRDPATGNVHLWLIDQYLRDGYWLQAEFGLLGSRPDWTPTHWGDFDGDGTSDLVWRNAGTGETALWLMKDGWFAQGAIVMAAAAWRVTHVADFDGDGTSDLVWHNGATGQTAIWLMNGLQYHGWSFVMQDRNWRVEQVGDFDGDGKLDLVWRSAAATAIWLMNGTSMREGAIVQQNGDWRVEQVGDIDGDGRDDLVWSGPDDQVAMYLMDGIVRRDGARLPPGTGRPIAMADFEGDGQSDLIVDTALGTYRYLLDGLGVRSATLVVPLAYHVERAADYDGDGIADLLVSNPTGSGPEAMIAYTPLYQNPVGFYITPHWKPLKPTATACEQEPCLTTGYRAN